MATLNLRPFIESLRVLDKKSQVAPFVPNRAQDQIIDQVKLDYEQGKPSRILSLKGRQMGISTVTEAILFAKAIVFPNTHAKVVAHDSDSSEYLFSMTRRFYDTWDLKDLFKRKYASSRHMVFADSDSSISVATAGNPDALRSRTITDAHFSEAAFYDDPVKLMGGANQAIPDRPGTLKLLESTANGMGTWFEEVWLEAKAGKNEYTPFFFEWWKHYEYRPCGGDGCRDATCKVCEKAAKGIRPKDDEERALLKMGAPLAALAWRRFAIPNKCFNNIDLWHQEYPDTPEMAFISSGLNAFPEEDLKKVYKPQRPAVGSFVVQAGEVKFMQSAEGAWRIYKVPDRKEAKWNHYFIGADPCFGDYASQSVPGDFAAAQIINRHTKEVVATFQGRLNPHVFADELAKAGKFYNDAVIACETAGGGLTTIERLRHIYPRLWFWHNPSKQLGSDFQVNSLGWETNWRTKTWMITKLNEVIHKGLITIHDERTYKELRSYTYYGGKGYVDTFGPADQERGKDDLVMSLAIAIVCESQESPLEDYAKAEAPKGYLLEDTREEPEWE